MGRGKKEEGRKEKKAGKSNRRVVRQEFDLRGEGRGGGKRKKGECETPDPLVSTLCTYGEKGGAGKKKGKKNRENERVTTESREKKIQRGKNT